MDCETGHFQIIHIRSPREHQTHILATSQKTTVLILILLHSLVDFRFPAPGTDRDRQRQRSIVLSFLSSEERKWPEEEGGNKRSKEPFGRRRSGTGGKPYSLRGISNLSTYRGRARLQQASSEAPSSVFLPSLASHCREQRGGTKSSTVTSSQTWQETNFPLRRIGNAQQLLKRTPICQRSRGEGGHSKQAIQ